VISGRTVVSGIVDASSSNLTVLPMPAASYSRVHRSSRTVGGSNRLLALLGGGGSPPALATLRASFTRSAELP
jgi:hypothetical protein